MSGIELEVPIPWKRVAELAGVGVCMIDRNFEILYVNGRVAEMLGYSVAEMMGRNLLLFVPEDLRKGIADHLKDQNEGTFLDHEFTFLRKDARTISVSISLDCVRDVEGRFENETFAIIDITKRKCREELLDASRNTLKTVFDAISGSLRPVDGEGRISALMNRITHLLENDILIHSTEEEQQTLDEIRLHTEHIKELLEERIQELLKAETLAAVGQAAAMIAHDLRNPLQDIRLAQYLLEKGCPDGREKEKMMKLLNQIDRNIAYADRIIDSLLIYSRECPLNRQETNIDQLLHESLGKSAPPEQIKVEENLGKVPNVFIDQNLMKRVFQNLTLNAFQAMERRGTLTLETKLEEGSIVISVQDTGKGISEIEQNLIWKPFYTSKAKGMGLGLPIAKRIVEMHGGTIVLKSKPHEGSTFTIRLPVTVPNTKVTASEGKTV